MTKFERICDRLKSTLMDARDDLPLNTDARQAAVALILRERAGEAEILMIKRAISPRDHWSGNLALPGGRWQAEDASLLVTAMRETEEEVGIALSAGGEVLGRLDTLKTRNPLVPQIDVTPFVFAAHMILGLNEQANQLKLNQEVDAAFWVSVDFLKSQGPSEIVEMVIEGNTRTWPAYPSEHGLIWGMTERMLSDFLELIS